MEQLVHKQTVKSVKAKIYKQNLSRKRLNNGHFYLYPAVTPVGSVQQQMSVLISIPILGLLKKYPIHHNISEKHINFRDSSSLVMDQGFKGLLGEWDEEIYFGKIVHSDLAVKYNNQKAGCAW